MKSLRDEILEKLPMRLILKPRDLVKLGIASTSTLVRMRKLGIGPRWFQIADRCIGYLREDVVEWLIQNQGMPEKRTETGQESEMVDKMTYESAKDEIMQPSANGEEVRVKFKMLSQ